MDAGVPLNSTIAAVTCALTADGALMLDPTEKEEQVLAFLLLEYLTLITTVSPPKGSNGSSYVLIHEHAWWCCYLVHTRQLYRGAIYNMLKCSKGFGGDSFVLLPQSKRAAIPARVIICVVCVLGARTWLKVSYRHFWRSRKWLTKGSMLLLEGTKQRCYSLATSFCEK